MKVASNLLKVGELKFWMGRSPPTPSMTLDLNADSITKRTLERWEVEDSRPASSAGTDSDGTERLHLQESPSSVDEKRDVGIRKAAP